MSSHRRALRASSVRPCASCRLSRRCVNKSNSLIRLGASGWAPDAAAAAASECALLSVPYCNRAPGPASLCPCLRWQTIGPFAYEVRAGTSCHRFVTRCRGPWTWISGEAVYLPIRVLMAARWPTLEVEEQRCSAASPRGRAPARRREWNDRAADDHEPHCHRHRAGRLVDRIATTSIPDHFRVLGVWAWRRKGHLWDRLRTYRYRLRNAGVSAG